MVPRIVLIAGPTAAGKSTLALELARRVGGELVSVDSVQLYRGLDIGSAKPSLAEQAAIPHHLIDVLDVDEPCNVSEFADLALAAIAEITARGKMPIAVGGTNLYVRVLVHGIFDAPPPSAAIRQHHQEWAARDGVPALHDALRAVDPVLADRTHPNDLVRVSRGLEVFELTGKPLSQHQDEHAFRVPNVEALKIAVNRPRAELYARIDARVDAMIEAGLLAEVAAIADAGYDLDLKPLQSLGYRHMGDVLRGRCSLPEAVTQLKRDTRRFAKQQISWLRSEQDVLWTLADVDVEVLLADVERFMRGEPLRRDWVVDSTSP